MHVLLVEDEPAIAEAVVYALESERITCHWSSTCCDALKAVQHHNPELILLDIGLPDGNGFDLFKELKTLSSASIVFLTSRHSELDEVLGLELGADDYITKPFSPRVLTSRVRMLLRRTNPQVTSSSQHPVIEHDKTAARVRVRGTPLDLSRYEYGVLALLIDHPERIYSRDTLMDLVWQRTADSYDRTVDTHIKTIRQKIKAQDSELDPIKTRRGLGYCFEVPAS
jgi:two-component system catabolic regulation response regulator CreB